MKRKLFAILMSLTMVLAYMPAMAFAEGTERWDGSVQTGTISVGDTQEVNVAESYDYASFEFVPAQSGTYCFRSDGDYDTYGRIMQNNKVVYSNDDNDAEDTSNFKIVFSGEAGQVYYLQASMYSGSTGSFNVSLATSDEDPDTPVTPDEPDDPIDPDDPEEEDDWGISFEEYEDEYILPASGSATLEVEPWFDGARKSLTYQWYKGTRKGVDDFEFTPISGKTSTSLAVSSPGRYMCRATNTASGATCDAEIDVRSWWVDYYDGDTIFHPGSPLTLNVKLGGRYNAANLKYEWYIGKEDSQGRTNYEPLQGNASSYTIPGTHVFDGEEETYKCVIVEYQGGQAVVDGYKYFYVEKGNIWWVKNNHSDIDLPDSGSCTLTAELAGTYDPAKMTFQWCKYEDNYSGDEELVPIQGATKQTFTVTEQNVYVCKVVNTETQEDEEAYFYVYYPTYETVINNVIYFRAGHTVAEGAVAFYTRFNGTSFAFPASVRLKDGKTYPVTEIAAKDIHVGDDGIYLGFNCKTVTVPASVRVIDKYALGYYFDETTNYTWRKIPGFTILGTTGSAAQKYAAANGFAFRDPAAEALKRNGVADSKIPKVKIKKPAAKKNAVTVKWTKLNKKQLKKSKAAKYEVWVSTSKSFPAGATTKEVFKSKGKSSAKITGLKKKTKYFVKVRAIKYVGGVKHVGKWSSVKSVKTKK